MRVQNYCGRPGSSPGALTVLTSLAATRRNHANAEAAAWSAEAKEEKLTKYYWETVKRKPLRFKPGTFDHSGFGYGTYWSKGGPVHCLKSEAVNMADEEGAEFVYIDRLAISSSYNPSKIRQQFIEE